MIDDKYRRLMHAMTAYLDHELGRVVDLLQTRGMWNDTLLVFHADNGGEIMAAGICGGNNWPLTGGKFSNWEGGIRVNAFVSGGALPLARRGQKEESYVTAWDWYVTRVCVCVCCAAPRFSSRVKHETPLVLKRENTHTETWNLRRYSTYAAIAGVDPTDHLAAGAGLPPIDSINQWPLISGVNGTSKSCHLPPATCQRAVQCVCVCIVVLCVWGVHLLLARVLTVRSSSFFLFSVQIRLLEWRSWWGIRRRLLRTGTGRPSWEGSSWGTTSYWSGPPMCCTRSTSRCNLP